MSLTTNIGRHKVLEGDFKGMNIIFNCAICQNELNIADFRRMNLDSSTVESHLDMFQGEQLIREAMVYKFTYSGMSDLCSQCKRSLEMYIKNNNIDSQSKAQDYCDVWYLNRFNTTVRKHNKEIK